MWLTLCDCTEQPDVAGVWGHQVEDSRREEPGLGRASEPRLRIEKPQLQTPGAGRINPMPQSLTDFHIPPHIPPTLNNFIFT